MTVNSDAEEAAELLHNVVKRSQRVLDGRLSVHGLSMARAKVLIIACTKGPLRQGEIATEFGIAPRTVTELVDSLERDGFVERREDVTDRRAREIHVTAAGKDVLDDVLSVRDEVIRYVIEALGPERLKEFIETLRTICERIGELDTSSDPTISDCIAAELGSEMDLDVRASTT